jgi:PASTA domain-containing protein
MAFGTRVWSAGKLVVLVGALIATYVVFAAAAMRIAIRAREVQVPNLTNQTANDATVIAGAVGLTVKVDDARRPDAKIAAGRVLAQEPPAGSIARRQRSVKVWISAGPRAATVPGLVGETERTAQLRLAQDGLTLTGIAEIRSHTFAGQSRRARRHLRDAGFDRRQRRSRRRNPARARLPRCRRRFDAVSRRRGRHRDQAESASGFSNRSR